MSGWGRGALLLALLVAGTGAGAAEPLTRLRCAAGPPAAAAGETAAAARGGRGSACGDVLDGKYRRAMQMRAWHAEYLRWTRPVRLAYAPVLAFLRGGGGNLDAASACRLLAEETSRALADPERFRSPDERLSHPLLRAFTSLRDAGLACSRHHDAVARAEADNAQGYLARAAQVLDGYGLQP